MKPPFQSQVHRLPLPSKGWGPFRYEWYSICSGHSRNKNGNYYGHDIDCPRCMAGRWINCWLREIGSYFHDNYYPLWFWWANRPKYSLKQAYYEARKYKNVR
jgi:hypothetical protein